jgi:hypothetical protein
MSEHRILQRIGAKLRDESRDIVDARLPERLRGLIEHIALLEKHEGSDQGTSNVIAMRRP